MSDPRRIPAESEGALAPDALGKVESSKDVVLIGPPTADGEGVHVLRARDERIETGELRALREGKPITGEVVTLKPREGQPRICDVTESIATRPRAQEPARLQQPARLPAPAGPRKGPAQVASEAYRDGWEGIFGASRPSTLN